MTCHHVFAIVGPTLENIVLTIEGHQTMWRQLPSSEMKKMDQRNNNQDMVENFILEIEADGRRDIKPTPRQLEAAHKTQLFRNITSFHPILGANCRRKTGIPRFCTFDESGQSL
ncbi:hypothetical protein QAD02_020483 [Eretmocerus hayati]|uniref:Uncharacterized protein n=1 Tax=Eretmocerus hayati TaxID=131215 RepID=A0ACC2PSC5_9HYME|nr:hypothetical protein QAD02_020483 [Eretmocerus hayati]